MTPFLFNLDYVLDMVRGVSSSQSSTGHLCPVCGSIISVCRDSNLLYCYQCRSVFDPLLYFDSVSETNNPASSFDKIVHNGGTIGKVNKSTSDAYIDTVALPLAAWNHTISRSSERLESGEWTRSHGDLLRSLKVYCGTTTHGLEAAKATYTLWSDYDMDKASMGLGRPFPEADKHKTAVALPLWSKSGMSGICFMSVDRCVIYPFRNDELGSGGFLYLKETEQYSNVIAINDPSLVLELQTAFYLRFQRYAPIVSFNGMTTERDWETLSHKESVIVVGTDPLGDTQALSAGVVLPGARYKQVRKPSELLANLRFDSVIESSVRDLFSMVSEAKPGVKKKVIQTIYTMNADAFIQRSVQTYGKDTVVAAGFSSIPNIFRSVEVSGKVFEERPSGYVCISGQSPEQVSNFTVNISRLLRFKETNRTEYLCTITISGRQVNIRVNHDELSCRRSPDNLISRIVDCGSTSAPIVNRKYLALFYDIVMSFSKPPASIVVERPGWDNQVGRFLLPAASVSLDGSITTQTDFIDKSLPLSTPGEVRADLIPILGKDLSRFIASISIYTVYSLLLEAGVINSRSTVMAVPSYASFVDSVLKGILRTGLPCLQQTNPNIINSIGWDSVAGTAVVELPTKITLLSGTLGLSVVPASSPKCIPISRTNDITALYDTITIFLLGQCLIWKDSLSDFNSVNQLCTKYLCEILGSDITNLFMPVEDCFTNYLRLTKTNDLEEIMKDSSNSGLTIDQSTVIRIPGVIIDSGRIIQNVERLKVSAK